MFPKISKHFSERVIKILACGQIALMKYVPLTTKVVPPLHYQFTHIAETEVRRFK